MSSASSAEPSPRTASPASSVEMGKPAVLLIGGITHAQKEWEQCSSFAELKVGSFLLLLDFSGRYEMNADFFGRLSPGPRDKNF